jgi:hypothetical protein
LQSVGENAGKLTHFQRNSLRLKELHRSGGLSLREEGLVRTTYWPGLDMHRLQLDEEGAAIPFGRMASWAASPIVAPMPPPQQRLMTDLAR